jgi:hypothetical protein
MKRTVRRGASVVEIAIVLSAISVAGIVGYSTFGNSTRRELNQTSGEWGNPSSVTSRYGNNPTSTDKTTDKSRSGKGIAMGC